MVAAVAQKFNIYHNYVLIFLKDAGVFWNNALISQNFCILSL